ncbi:MAG: hypothetical protein JNM94_05965 [Phycisphaerae bacterium]|nr:hypothetical protein [Phycisphaerae bacterium]
MTPSVGESGDGVTAGAAPAERAADLLVRSDRVARRLHGEFSTFLRELPVDARNASGLARHLAIDRTTCQRLVFAVSRPYPGVELFSRLPGLRALEQIVDAAHSAKPPIDDAVAAGALAALDQLRELVVDAGGSLSSLMRLLDSRTRGTPVAVDTTLRATPAISALQAPKDSGADARARLFAAAADLTGRLSDGWLAVYIYRPLPSKNGAPAQVELIRAHGLVGHVARADAVPLTLHNFTTKSSGVPDESVGAFASLFREPESRRTLDSLLTEFTSDPPPLVRSKQPNEFLVQAIDERASTVGRPVDFVLATRTVVPHPALQSPPIEEAWALINFPCRHLAFDIYLHRDLARACIPSLDAHLWRPDFAQHVGDRWQTRFADAPTLQVLGSGLRTPPTPAYPRLGELTRHLFTRLELEAESFVGFRCEVAYPIWRAGYCVSLDFTSPAADVPAT